MPFEFSVEREWLGTWEPYLFDKEKDVQVFLRIRPMTEDATSKVNKKFGKLKMIKAQGVRQRQIPEGNRTEAGFARVSFMWTGIRNGYIKMVDEPTAAFFGEKLGKKFSISEEVLLPEDLWHPVTLDENAPRPFDDIKRLMLEQDTRISSKVVDIGMGTDSEAVEDEKKEAQEKVKQEQELEKN
ncbi:MAG: hypothetical protein GY896_22980 [Gammaproteobacteria bacterium]|nr:hypothetical protein [Gammaproteobacteria bacterium]